MLRQAITHVSGLAVLMHLALGFCAHHGHAAAVSQPANGPASHAGCHHEHGSPASDRPELPPHDDCHDTHCSATKAIQFASPDADSSFAWLDLPAAVFAHGGVLPQPAASGLAASHELPAPPLRAHLLCQVLLI